MPISIGSERVIAGTGAGVFSYLSDTTIWTTTNNTTASATPELIPGGTANSGNFQIVASSTGTGLLSGTTENVFTKLSGSFQGYSVRSADLDLEARHRAKVLQLSFDYMFTGTSPSLSANYTNGDITVWILDVTVPASPILIQPTTYQIIKNNDGVPSKFLTSFQTNITTSKFKVVFHLSGTNANAFTLKISDFFLGEPAQSVGAVITDWRSYTPTITETSGNVISNIAPTSFRWRRNGSSIEIQGRIGGGVLGTYSDIHFSLPPGITGIADGTAAHVGTGYFYRHGSTAFQAIKLEGNSTFTRIRLSYLEYVSTVTQYMQFLNSSPNITYTGTSLDYFYVETVPIQVQGWGSTVAMSSDTGDGRVVSLVARSFTTAPGINQPVVFTTVANDTHNCYSSGLYRIPVPGSYRVTLSYAFAASASAHYSYVSVDEATTGSNIYTLGYTESTVQVSGGSVIVPNLRAGQTLSIRAGSVAFANSNGNAILSIDRISAGTQQIAASETVAVRYTSTSGQSIPTSSVTDLNFANRIFDTHGAVTNPSTNWTFTAPIRGYYRIDCGFGLNVITNVNGGIKVGVSTVIQSNLISSTGTKTNSTLLLNSGDTIKVWAYQSSGSLQSLNASDQYNYVSIERIGL